MKARGPMRAVICVLFDVLCVIHGGGDSVEMTQVLSRDILSVHWARAATHWDGESVRRLHHQAPFAVFRET